MLDEYNKPYLSDFGSSKKINNPNEMINSGYGQGTLPYSAPKIFNDDDDNFDPFKADIYAFGIVMFEIVTNQKPYNKFSINDLNRIIYENYRPIFENDENKHHIKLIQR